MPYFNLRGDILMSIARADIRTIIGKSLGVMRVKAKRRKRDAI
jgi:hypothetical protein